MMFWNCALPWQLMCRVMCSNCNSCHVEDWAVETQLVHDFTHSTEQTLPRRNELDGFVARSVICNAMPSRHELGILLTSE